ncbi:MAG: hypothetical protein EA369_08310 [Bradymonadales bacterium]|nr:MAG: hypothetical protein EA369_08310 [Bradymonadales bacterium]
MKRHLFTVNRVLAPLYAGLSLVLLACSSEPPEPTAEKAEPVLQKEEEDQLPEGSEEAFDDSAWEAEFQAYLEELVRAYRENDPRFADPTSPHLFGIWRMPDRLAQSAEPSLPARSSFLEPKKLDRHVSLDLLSEETEKLYERYRLFYTRLRLEVPSEDQELIEQRAEEVFSIRSSLMEVPKNDDGDDLYRVEDLISVLPLQIAVILSHYESWHRFLGENTDTQFSEVSEAPVDEGLLRFVRVSGVSDKLLAEEPPTYETEEVEIENLRDLLFALAFARQDLIASIYNLHFSFFDQLSLLMSAEQTKAWLGARSKPVSFSEMRSFSAAMASLNPLYVPEDETEISDSQKALLFHDFQERLRGRELAEISLQDLIVELEGIELDPKIRARPYRVAFQFFHSLLRSRDTDQSRLFYGRSPMELLEFRAQKAHLLESSSAVFQPEDYLDHIFNDGRFLERRRQDSRTQVEFDFEYRDWGHDDLGNPVSFRLEGLSINRFWNPRMLRQEQYQVLVARDLQPEGEPKKRAFSFQMAELLDYSFEDLLRLHFIRSKIPDFALFESNCFEFVCEEYEFIDLWPSARLQEIANQLLEFEREFGSQFEEPLQIHWQSLEEFKSWRSRLLGMQWRVRQYASNLPFEALGLGREDIDERLFFHFRQSLRLYEYVERRHLNDPRFEGFPTRPYSFRSVSELHQDLQALVNRLRVEHERARQDLAEAFERRLAPYFKEEKAFTLSSYQEDLPKRLRELRQERLKLQDELQKENLGSAKREALEARIEALSDESRMLLNYNEVLSIYVNEFNRIEESTSTALSVWPRGLDLVSIRALEFIVNNFSPQENLFNAIPFQPARNLINWIQGFQFSDPTDHLLWLYELEFVAQELKIEKLFFEKLSNQSFESFSEAPGEWTGRTGLFLTHPDSKRVRAKMLQKLREHSILATFFHGGEHDDLNFYFRVPTSIDWLRQKEEEVKALFLSQGAKLDDDHWKLLLSEAAEFVIRGQKEDPEAWQARRQQALRDLIERDLFRLSQLIQPNSVLRTSFLAPWSQQDRRTSWASTLAKLHLEEEVDYREILGLLTELFWVRIEQTHGGILRLSQDHGERVEEIRERLRVLKDQLESRDKIPDFFQDFWLIFQDLLDGDLRALAVQAASLPLVERRSADEAFLFIRDPLSFGRFSSFDFETSLIFEAEEQESPLLPWVYLRNSSVQQLWSEAQEIPERDQFQWFWRQMVERDLSFFVTPTQTREIFQQRRRNAAYFTLADIPAISAREIAPDDPHARAHESSKELRQFEQAAIGRALHEASYTFSSAFVADTLSYDQLWSLIFMQAMNNPEANRLRRLILEVSPRSSRHQLKGDNANAEAKRFMELVGLVDPGSVEEKRLIETLNREVYNSLRKSYTTLVHSWFSKAERLYRSVDRPQSGELSHGGIRQLIELALEDPDFRNILIPPPKETKNPMEQESLLSQYSVDQDTAEHILYHARLRAPASGFFASRRLRAQLRDLREFMVLSKLLMRSETGGETSFTHLLSLFLAPNLIKDLALGSSDQLIPEEILDDYKERAIKARTSALARLLDFTSEEEQLLFQELKLLPRPEFERIWTLVGETIEEFFNRVQRIETRSFVYVRERAPKRDEQLTALIRPRPEALSSLWSLVEKLKAKEAVVRRKNEDMGRLRPSEEGSLYEIDRAHRNYYQTRAFPSFDLAQEAFSLLLSDQIYQGMDLERAIRARLKGFYSYFEAANAEFRSKLPDLDHLAKILTEAHQSGRLSFDELRHQLQFILILQFDRSRRVFLSEADQDLFERVLLDERLRAQERLGIDFYLEGYLWFEFGTLAEGETRRDLVREDRREAFLQRMDEWTLLEISDQVKKIRERVPSDVFESLQMDEWIAAMESSFIFGSDFWKIESTVSDGREMKRVVNSLTATAGEATDIVDPGIPLRAPMARIDSLQIQFWTQWMKERLSGLREPWFRGLAGLDLYPGMKEGINKAHANLWHNLQENGRKFETGGLDRLGHEEFLREVFGPRFRYFAESPGLVGRVMDHAKSISRNLEPHWRSFQSLDHRETFEALGWGENWADEFLHSMLRQDEERRAARKRRAEQRAAEKSSEENSRARRLDLPQDLHAMAEELSAGRRGEDKAEPSESSQGEGPEDDLVSFLLNPGQMDSIFFRINMLRELLRLRFLDKSERTWNIGHSWPEASVEELGGEPAKEFLFQFVDWLRWDLEYFGDDSVLALDWSKFSADSLEALVHLWLERDIWTHRENSRFFTDPWLRFLPEKLYYELLPKLIESLYEADLIDSFESAYYQIENTCLDQELFEGSQGFARKLGFSLKQKSSEGLDHSPMGVREVIAADAAGCDQRWDLYTLVHELLWIHEVYRQAEQASKDPQLLNWFSHFRELIRQTRALLGANEAVHYLSGQEGGLDSQMLSLVLNFHRLQEFSRHYELNLDHLNVGMTRLAEFQFGILLGDYSELFEQLERQERPLWQKAVGVLGEGAMGAAEFIYESASFVLVGLPYFIGETAAVIFTQAFLSEEQLLSLMGSFGAWEEGAEGLYSKQLPWYDPRRYSLWRMENVQDFGRFSGLLAANVTMTRFFTAGLTTRIGGLPKEAATTGTQALVVSSSRRTFQSPALPAAEARSGGRLSQLQQRLGSTRVGQATGRSWSRFESVMTRPFYMFHRPPNVAGMGSISAIRDLSMAGLPLSSGRILLGMRAASAGQMGAMVAVHSTALVTLMGLPAFFHGEGGAYLRAFPEHLGTTMALITTLMLSHRQLHSLSRRHPAFAYANFGMSRGLLAYIMKEAMVSGGEVMNHWWKTENWAYDFVENLIYPLLGQLIEIELEAFERNEGWLYEGIEFEKLSESDWEREDIQKAWDQYQEHRFKRQEFFSHLALISWLMAAPRIGDLSERMRRSESQRSVNIVQSLFPRTTQPTRDQVVAAARNFTLQEARIHLARDKNLTPKEVMPEAVSRSTELHLKLFGEGALLKAMNQIAISGYGRRLSARERQEILSEVREAVHHGIEQAHSILRSTARGADAIFASQMRQDWNELTLEAIVEKTIKKFGSLERRPAETDAAYNNRIAEARDFLNQHHVDSILAMTLEGRAYLAQLRDLVLLRERGEIESWVIRGVDHLALTPDARVFEALFFKNMTGEISAQAVRGGENLLGLRVPAFQRGALIERIEGASPRQMRDRVSIGEQGNQLVGEFFPLEMRWVDSRRGFELTYRGSSDNFKIEFGAQGEVFIQVRTRSGEIKLEMRDETVFLQREGRLPHELGWREAELMPVLKEMNLQAGPGFVGRLKELFSGAPRFKRSLPPYQQEPGLSLPERMFVHLNPRQTRRAARLLNREELGWTDRLAESLTGRLGGLSVRERIEFERIIETMKNPDASGFKTSFHGEFKWMGRRVSGEITVEVRGRTVRTIFPDGSEVVRFKLDQAPATSRADRSSGYSMEQIERIIDQSGREARRAMEREGLSEAALERKLQEALQREGREELDLTSLIRRQSQDPRRQEGAETPEYAIFQFRSQRDFSRTSRESRRLENDGEYVITNEFGVELRIGGSRQPNTLRMQLEGFPYLLRETPMIEMAAVIQTAAMEANLPQTRIVQGIAQFWSNQFRQAMTEPANQASKRASRMTQEEINNNLKLLQIHSNEWRLVTTDARLRLIETRMENQLNKFPLGENSTNVIFRWSIERAATDLRARAEYEAKKK